MQIKNLIEGSIDFHTHTSPSIRTRLKDDYELASEASSYGLAALVLKSHEGSTVERAFLTQKVIKDVKMYGGVVLNYSMGGLNPFAVETALKLGGKIIWMPTLDALNHTKLLGRNSFYSKEIQGITVLNSDGELSKESLQIIELAGQYNAVIATGHLEVSEVFKLAEEAIRVKFDKLLYNHPDFFINNASIEDQIQLAKMGVYMEKCYRVLIPPPDDTVCIEDLAEGIKKIGFNKCIIATDLGQSHNISPLEGLQKFISLLVEQGLEPESITTMVAEQPKYLLNYSNG